MNSQFGVNRNVLASIWFWLKSLLTDSRAAWHIKGPLCGVGPEAGSDCWDRRVLTHWSLGMWQQLWMRIDVEGILPKGPYLPCVSMAGRALLAGYPRYLEHSLCNYPQVNALRTLDWWFVNIVSGHGLVPSGNKPLPEPMLTLIYVVIWHL